MVRLTLISDDLTGAFDATVPFVGAGVDVVTSLQTTATLTEALAGKATVVAANADSRHLTAFAAFMRVTSAVEVARAAGCTVILKKTDSVLRGNVGAELSALWQATGGKSVHFVPAWPSMGRTTKGGTHYVNGTPVSQSPFGHDPFEAVVTSGVRDLLHQQCDVPIIVVGEDAPAPLGFEGVVVYDATTEEALERRVRELWQAHEQATDGQDVLALAGCAGLTRALAAVCGVPQAPANVAASHEGGLLAFCGSVNAVTVAQCAKAAAAGAASFRVTEDQKVSDGWTSSPECEALCADVVAAWDANDLTVLDATDFTADVPADVIVEHRAIISRNLGQLAAAIVRAHPTGRMLTTGGDVLLSLLDALGCERVRLLGEAECGVVATEVEVDDGNLCVFTKSGGFGSEDLFVRLAQPAR